MLALERVAPIVALGRGEKDGIWVSLGRIAKILTYEQPKHEQAAMKPDVAGMERAKDGRQFFCSAEEDGRPTRPHVFPTVALGGIAGQGPSGREKIRCEIR